MDGLHAGRPRGDPHLDGLGAALAERAPAFR